jgi:peroxiredoxin Q/BCP
MASVDKPEDNKGFAEKNEATFPILSDVDKSVSEAYGVLSPMGFAKRWTYYIDGQGTIAKIDKEVDPRTAGQTLVNSLQEMGVPEAKELLKGPEGQL